MCCLFAAFQSLQVGCLVVWGGWDAGALVDWLVTGLVA